MISRVRAGRPRRPDCRPAVGRLACALAGWAGLAALAPARADPGYYVVGAYDHAGRVSAELRYWTVSPDGRPAMLWPELGLAWGVNPRWTTRLLASWVGRRLDAQQPESLQWHNDWLLTQGEWPLDLALHTALRRGFRGHGDALEWGPVGVTDLGRTQLTGNLFFERGLGRGDDRPTQLKYQWQLRHRWQPGLHLGAQGFGELGRWDDWAAAGRQSHRLGPALFVTPGPQGARPLQLQLAWLRGKTYGRPGHMLSLQLQWHLRQP